VPDTYVTIPEAQGSIHISEDVIAVIAANAVNDVEGVASFSAGTAAELSELICKKNAAKGIRVSFSEESVMVSVSVLVRFGSNITLAGKNVQKAIAAAVEAMTGLKSTVDVHVTGVTFEK